MSNLDTTPTGERTRRLAAAVHRGVASVGGTRPGVLATRADLRRGLRRDIGALPAVWQYLPGDLSAAGDLVLARTLSLYALHHQHLRSADPHQPGVSLGRAFAAAMGRGGARGPDKLAREDATFARLLRVATLDDAVERLARLVPLLGKAGVRLDYVALARDLYALSAGDQQAARDVHTRWARQRAGLTS